MYHAPGCDDNGSLCPLSLVWNRCWVFCCEFKLEPLDSVCWSLVIAKAQLLAQLNSSSSVLHSAYQFLLNFTCGKPSKHLLWSKKLFNEILIWSLICCIYICTLLNFSGFVFLLINEHHTAYFLSNLLTLPSLTSWTWSSWEYFLCIYKCVCAKIYIKSEYICSNFTEGLTCINLEVLLNPANNLSKFYMIKNTKVGART